MSRTDRALKSLPTVFISYRRADTEAYAARVRDALKSHLEGRARVFWDYDDIPPGVDFVEAIREAIGASAALVAIIGRQWASIRDEETGRPRLENEKDHVRAEVASALRAGVRVIPVLVQDAQMPGEAQLPDDLKPLATRNALELSSKRWDYDSRRLLEAIEPSLPAAAAGRRGLLSRGLTRAAGPRWPLYAVVLAVAAAAAAYGVWVNRPGGAPVSRPGGASVRRSGDCSIAAVPGAERVSDEFIQKVCGMASRLGTDPSYLMAEMSYWSSGSFKPSISTYRGTQVGLIQFIPNTARSLGTTLEELAVMSPEEQLEYVEKYYEPFKGRLKTLEDVHMAVLYPAAVGAGGDHVLFREGSEIYDKSRKLDSNNDGVITVGEATTEVRRLLPG